MYSLDRICLKYKGTEIVLTLDGFKFAAYIAYVVCRVKVVDIKEIDPKYRNLLLKFQRHKYSCIFEIHLIKDTKYG